jgi:hypothetical protein
MSGITEAEFEHFAGTADIEDISPTELKAPPVRSHRRRERPPWLRLAD